MNRIQLVQITLTFNDMCHRTSITLTHELTSGTPLPPGIANSGDNVA